MQGLLPDDIHIRSLEGLPFLQGARIPRNAPSQLNSPRQHLGERFLASADQWADRTAIVTGQQTYHYRDLMNATAAVSHALQRLPGFEPGCRVAILLRNSPEYVAAFYGIQLAGAVAVPLPADIESGRLTHLLHDCDAFALFWDAKSQTRRQELLERSESLAADPTDEPAPLQRLCHLPGDDALAAIFYTSGSTGTPKGVMLSHRNLIANAESICEYLSIDETERALAVLPFYHAFGNSILQTHLLRGATLILDGNPMFPESLIEALNRHEATSFSAVPELYQILLQRSSLGETPTPSLRYMTVAGGGLPADRSQELARRIAPAEFFVMYGQTEATARLSFLPPHMIDSHAGSIGRGIPGVELQVVDHNDLPVAAGEPGRLRARGENVMLGYWKAPEATAAVLRAGWLYTGDRATIDHDGMIFLCGRDSDLLKIGGFRVHPREIEEFVTSRFPRVRAAAVPMETAQTGTRLALFLQSDAPDFDEQLIIQTCRQELPVHQVPGFVQTLAEFPLNSSMKLDRLALRARCSDGSHAPRSQSISHSV